MRLNGLACQIPMQLLIPGDASTTDARYSLSSAVYYAGGHYSTFIRGVGEMSLNGSGTRESTEEVFWHFNSWPESTIKPVGAKEFNETYANSLELVAFVRDVI